MARLVAVMGDPIYFFVGMMVGVALVWFFVSPRLREYERTVDDTIRALDRDRADADLVNAEWKNALAEEGDGEGAMASVMQTPSGYRGQSWGFWYRMRLQESRREDQLLSLREYADKVLDGE